MIDGLCNFDDDAQSRFGAGAGDEVTGNLDRSQHDTGEGLRGQKGAWMSGESSNGQIGTAIFVTVAGTVIGGILLRTSCVPSEPPKPIPTVSGNWVNEYNGLRYNIVATSDRVVLSLIQPSPLPPFVLQTTFEGQGPFIDDTQIKVVGFNALTGRTERFEARATNDLTTVMVGQWFDETTGQPVQQVRLIKQR